MARPEVMTTAMEVVVAGVVDATVVMSRLKTHKQKLHRSRIRQHLLSPIPNSVRLARLAHQHLRRLTNKPICKQGLMRKDWQKTIRIRLIRNANAVVVAAVAVVVVRTKAHHSKPRTVSKSMGLSTPQAPLCLVPLSTMLNLVLPAPSRLPQHLLL